MCNHDVYIVRFYVFIHVSMRIMYLYPYFVACLKQCIVGVSEIDFKSLPVCVCIVSG